MLPRDAASIPSSLKGIQEEEREQGDGLQEAGLEEKLSQCLLLALNLLKKPPPELQLDNFGVGFLMRILEGFSKGCHLECFG